MSTHLRLWEMPHRTKTLRVCQRQSSGENWGELNEDGQRSRSVTDDIRGQLVDQGPERPVASIPAEVIPSSARWSISLAETLRRARGH